MDNLVSRYGRLQLKRRPAFIALSRSIIAQQISTKAADTIRGRLEFRFASDPERVASATLADVRALGLSEAKARCLRLVAEHCLRGDFDDFEHLSDADVVRRLCAIAGIGLWTAQMFLIFCLARPDVWPIADAGLRAAALRLYQVTSKHELDALGCRFSPNRSLAALYLWRSLENVRV